MSSCFTGRHSPSRTSARGRSRGLPGEAGERSRATSRRALTVLVATSGDTGSAVAHAFFGVPARAWSCCIPKARSAMSRKRSLQHSAATSPRSPSPGPSTIASASRRKPLPIGQLQSRVRLTSANSISLGRLIPQMFYYAYAALQSIGGHAADDFRAVRQLRQPGRGRNGLEDGRADPLFLARRRRSTTRCRAISHRAASSRSHRCKRWRMRWMLAIPATSNGCSGCLTATGGDESGDYDRASHG